MSFLLEAQIVRVRRYFNRRKADRLRAQAMARPFSPDARSRLLLVTQPERLPQSQIYPFHHYAADLRRLYGTDLREADLWDFVAGRPVAARGATVVAFQTPFDVSDAELDRLFARINADHPGARIACLDWFAPTDLRNAARLNDRIHLYIKKHVLRDRDCYGKPTLGDTNLTDYYARRLRLEEPERLFPIPPGFLDKLVIGPSFITAPTVLPALLGKPPLNGHRQHDLHARFELDGTPWYRGMRAEADAAVNALKGVSVVRGTGVHQARFLAELRHSKVCFSPFGYGEVCWRDYEAVLSGAVLVKPDMSHIVTDPDIFIPWETYVPVAWDLSDLPDALHRLLGDAALRSRIATQAFETLRKWLGSDRFARQMAPLLAG
ncbi:glycosyltransferase [Tabrizicola thermarum]|uniref:glycosyltransferase n=1 Tax=Tabrizicola thermarum TaxID=2670345 RepID=UPI000FFBD55C|nr:glycosyltransferase [Tabrizicola thermarum]